MKLLSKVIAAGLVAGGTSAAAGVAGVGVAVANAAGVGSAHAVFVETDNTAGNQVSSYARAADGSLRLYATYQTEGAGGQLNGSVVDHQASQGALDYDATDQLLYASNAGSNTISVFSVQGANLQLRQVISSGGTFPVSVTDHGGVVYVLNARDGGSVAGFRVEGGRLHALAAPATPLGLTPVTGDTEFTHTPGQVAFSPDGSELLVTTKAAGQSVDVFHVNANGALDTYPVVNPVGNVPFALSFAGAHRVMLVEAAGYVAKLSLDDFGNLHPIASVPTDQQASCWITKAGSDYYVSNAGSASLTGFSNSPGTVTDLGNTSTDPGTVDAAASPDGAFLYVQAGASGQLDSFAVGATGALTPVGSAVTVAGAAGGEGIATD